MYPLPQSDINCTTCISGIIKQGCKYKHPRDWKYITMYEWLSEPAPISKVSPADLIPTCDGRNGCCNGEYIKGCKFNHPAGWEETMVNSDMIKLAKEARRKSIEDENYCTTCINDIHPLCKLAHNINMTEKKCRYGDDCRYFKLNKCMFSHDL